MGYHRDFTCYYPISDIRGVQLEEEAPSWRPSTQVCGLTPRILSSNFTNDWNITSLSNPGWNHQPLNITKLKMASSWSIPRGVSSQITEVSLNPGRGPHPTGDLSVIKPRFQRVLYSNRHRVWGQGEREVKHWNIFLWTCEHVSKMREFLQNNPLKTMRIRSCVFDDTAKSHILSHLKLSAWKKKDTLW